MQKVDVAIVGGGVAGLTAAVYAARAGKKTAVIEKGERFGGRAVTVKKEGAYFNLGGHAAYRGDAYDTFRELGLRLQGGWASADAWGIWKGKLLALPTGVKSLFATPFLSWSGCPYHGLLLPIVVLLSLKTTPFYFRFRLACNRQRITKAGVF